MKDVIKYIEKVKCKECGQEIEREWMLVDYQKELEEKGLMGLCAPCVNKKVEHGPI